MIPSDSWKWLAPRLSLRDMFRRQPNRTARPCLPAVEPLGDRVMLSSTIGPIGASPDQILIGLLKSTIGQPDSDVSLLSDQLDALKIASKFEGGIKLMESHLLTDGFLKIENILFKFGESLIKGEIGDVKLNLFSQGLNDEFQKIQTLVEGVGGEGEGNLLLPAVQKVFDSASKLYSDLALLGPAVKVDYKFRDLFDKLSESFLNLNAGIVKIGEDVIFNKTGNKGTLEYLKITLEDILVTSALVGNGDFKAVLEEITGVAVNTLNTLLEPPPIFEEGPFTDGVVIVGDIIDDIITP